MDVSVIIVNYNTQALTQACIDSIYEQTRDVTFEVIVIDNASTDGSKETFEKDSKIRYVYSYENLGFGRANNVGMMLAKGDYFFLLNSDTLLRNNALKLFYEYAKKNKGKAFYGCWLENMEGEWVHSCSHKLTIGGLFRSAMIRYWKFLSGKKPIESVWNIPHTSEEALEVGDVTGADLFLHSSVYEETGGFDHRFFLYYEETDWEYRGHAKGIKSICINGPRIVHLEGGSQQTKGVNWRKLRIMYRSEEFFVRKHFSRLKYGAYKLFHIVTTGVPLFMLEQVKKRSLSK